jgi:dihydrodipicolinate synthase/N-acetylneuraminate lyase
MASSSPWRGVIACPLTPFDADGRVQCETFGRQLEFLVADVAAAFAPVVAEFAGR